MFMPGRVSGLCVFETGTWGHGEMRTKFMGDTLWLLNIAMEAMAH